MKVLLTGSSGILGGAIRRTIDSLPGWSVKPLLRPPPGAFAEWGSANICAGADIIIHAAANTNVEQCELHPDACYRDNFLLTQEIATGASRANCRVVYISSTGVYGNKKSTPYTEIDVPQPTTHHHRSKLLGEEAVLRCGPNNLVLRTGWLFGGALCSSKNFVVKRIHEASAADSHIFANAEQIGCPTYVDDVAAMLLAAIQLEVAGVLNCVNEGAASRFDYVKAILEFAGSSVIVQPAAAGAFVRRANVSHNESAVNWRAAALGLPAMPLWRDSLKRYIATFVE